MNTPAGTTIGRDLVLLGNGGIDVPQSSLNWSGLISGSGQFIKSEVGELDLTGLNIYSGGSKRLMDLPMAWSHQWTALGLKVPA